MRLFQSVLAPPALVVLLLLLATACRDGQSEDGVRLSLVAYSTPREAYAQLIKQFQATPAGTGVTFDESYAGSTEQSLAVRNGLSADVVALSLEPDITSLVNAGLVQSTWNTDAQRGMIADSVVVLAVRKGNPRNIQNGEDLVRPGIKVVTPNPFTSGGAQWNITAAYGAQLRSGKSAAQALEYMRELFAHVPVQAKSAREAMQAFIGGEGDALISYENEAITAQQAGEQIDYVIPASTILIETPVAVTTNARYPDQAQAFVRFLHTPEAQRTFARAGYRPVARDIAAEFDFQTPPQLFTIDDLGGWPKVQSALFDRRTGLVAGLFANQGIALDGN